MYERILVPLDGSKTAEMALPYAVEIAGKLCSQFFLVEVSESGSPDAEHLCQTYMERITDQVRLQLRGQEGAELVTVQNKVLTGKPADEILRYADQNKVSLIAMSRHGSSGEGPWFIGSIADKVLRAAKQSVLLIRTPASERSLRAKQLVRRILVPLDGSRVGETAIPAAEILARALGAELVLLRVVVPSSLQRDSFQGFIDPTLEELVTQAEKGQEDRKTSASKYLKRVGKPLRERGTPSLSVVVMGYPPDQIIDYAEANEVDLISMSSHGRTGIRRWLFGSVTDKVLHAGNTPLLVVRARKAYE